MLDEEGFIDIATMHIVARNAILKQNGSEAKGLTTRGIDVGGWPIELDKLNRGKTTHMTPYERKIRRL